MLEWAFDLAQTALKNDILEYALQVHVGRVRHFLKIGAARKKGLPGKGYLVDGVELWIKHHFRNHSFGEQLGFVELILFDIKSLGREILLLELLEQNFLLCFLTLVKCLRAHVDYFVKIRLLLGKNLLKLFLSELLERLTTKQTLAFWGCVLLLNHLIHFY